MKVNFTLFFFATVFFAYLGNAALEGWQRINDQATFSREIALQDEARRNGLLPDLRSKLEVVDDLSKTVKIYPSAYTHHILEDRLDKHNLGDALVPLGFISNAQYVLGNESGQWSVFKSDRFGFQNDDSQYSKLFNGNRPILLIGDSFIEGQHVGKDEDIASKMREKNLLAFSYGMGGSGPIRELAILKEYGSYLRPKVVMWCFAGLNDIDDLSTEMTDPFLKKYLDPKFSQNLVQRQVEIDQIWKEFLNRKIAEQRGVISKAPQMSSDSIAKVLATLQPFFNLYHLRKALALTMNDQRFNKALPVFQDILQQASSLCQQWETTFVFVYLPHKSAFKHQENRYNLKVKSMVRDMNIPIIDFTPIFIQAGDPFSFFPKHFYHYNAKGYNLVAQGLAEFLSRQ